jgi:hypothetical protein
LARRSSIIRGHYYITTPFPRCQTNWLQGKLHRGNNSAIAHEGTLNRPRSPRFERCTVRRYRLFLVDVLKRVKEEHAFEASSDDNAKCVANERRGSRPAELWNTHRRIARWD